MSVKPLIDSGRAQVEVGYGHFFAGDYIQSSLSNPNFGSQDANFVYAQVNLTF